MKKNCGKSRASASGKCGCECGAEMPEAGTLAEYVGWWILKRRKFFNKEMIPFFEKGNLEIAVKRELAAARDDYNKVFLRIRTALKKMR